LYPLSLTNKNTNYRFHFDDSFAIVLYIPFPFSFTKKSAIFAEVKRYFGWGCSRSLRTRHIKI
jgi:hypothetical protein